MKILGIGVVCITLLLALMWLDPTSVQRREDANAQQRALLALERQREALQLEREEYQYDLAQQSAPFTHWAGIAAITTVVLIGLAGVGGMLWLALARRATTIHVFKPDARGLLPVPDHVLAAAAQEALRGYFTAAVAQASNAGSPHVLTYSPTSELEYRAESANLLPGDTRNDSTPAPLALPGLTDAVQIGHTPSASSVLLGLGADASPVTVPLKHLWHIGMAGPTGTGKSNIARLVLPQILTLGAQVAIADPKWTPFDRESGEDWRPIAQRLHLEAAAKAAAIKDVLQWHVDELDQRLERRNAGERAGGPLFLYLDEVTTITADVKDAERHMARLTRLGRGVGIYLLTAAHNFLVKNGMGDTRDQIRTAFYLGGDKTTGAVLLDMPQREINESQLDVGVAYLRSFATRPAEIIRVPYASNDYIYDLLPSADTTQIDALGTGHGTGSALGRHSSATASQSQTPQSMQTARILALARQGTGVRAIVETVWGQKTGGSKYAERADEVMRVIAEALQQQEVS